MTRRCSGRFDILIIAIIALLIVGALIFVLLRIIGHSEEHVEKVRKTKINYEESLRWRSDNGLGEGRIRSDLEQNPDRIKVNYADLTLNENCLELIGRMQRLQELKLTRSTVKSSWLKHITNLPLRILGLNGTQITDKSIRYFLMIPTLDKLEIGDTEITDEGLKKLAKSRSIRYLSLSVGRRITNDGIKNISKMPQLMSLQLDDSIGVDGKCLAYIPDMQNLRFLNLENLKLTKEDLEHLASAKLSSLNLSNCQLDDPCLEPLTKISTLRALNLAGNNFTDKGLISLSKLPLTQLTVKACPGVTDSGVEKLKAAIPGCKILYANRTKFDEKMSKPGVKQELQLLENEAQNELKKTVVE